MDKTRRLKTLDQIFAEGVRVQVGNEPERIVRTATPWRALGLGVERFYRVCPNTKS